MKKLLLLLIPLILFIKFTPSVKSEPAPLQPSPIIKEFPILMTLPLEDDSAVVLTEKNLYQWNKKENMTRRIFPLSNSHPLKQVESVDSNFFLLSNRDLFRSNNNGKEWKQVFRAPSLGGERLTTFAVRTKKIILGSTKGLYSASLDEFRFKKIVTFPKDEIPIEIKCISEMSYYVLTDRSLWKTRDSGESFTKIFGRLPQEKEDIVEDLEEPLVMGDLTSLAADQNSHIGIGTSRGIFTFKSATESFERLSSNGLLSDFITEVLFTPFGLIVGTDNGVYLRQAEKWKSLVPELVGKTITDMNLSENTLWVTSEKAIHSKNLSIFEPISGPIQELHYLPDILRQIENLKRIEPNVREIQKAAIRYSNTRNWKTRSWQIFSRLKALMPDVSYGIGRSANNTIDLDRGGTKDEDAYIAGPIEWDEDWDISVSWDLGDLLFSTSQTSIDSREKLMVELRDEIVSEVTRLYFERRRLQIDLLFNKPSDRDAINQLLRIQELTAQIDGLTGGWFSKNTKRKESFTDKLQNLINNNGGNENGKNKRNEIE